MSEDIVVAAGQALCGHAVPPPPDQPPTEPLPFSVALTASDPVLKVNGAAVLLHKDFIGAEVMACAAQPPCKTVSAVEPGRSTVLTIRGDPVALAITAGTTNAGTFKVTSAGQSILKAK